MTRRIIGGGPMAIGFLPIVPPVEVSNIQRGFFMWEEMGMAILDVKAVYPKLKEEEIPPNTPFLNLESKEKENER